LSVEPIRRRLRVRFGEVLDCYHRSDTRRTYRHLDVTIEAVSSPTPRERWCSANRFAPAMVRDPRRSRRIGADTRGAADVLPVQRNVHLLRHRRRASGGLVISSRVRIARGADVGEHDCRSGKRAAASAGQALIARSQADWRTLRCASVFCRRKSNQDGISRFDRTTSASVAPRTRGRIAIGWSCFAPRWRRATHTDLRADER
jgi:hypothetical protein